MKIHPISQNSYEYGTNGAKQNANLHINPLQNLHKDVFENSKDAHFAPSFSGLHFKKFLGQFFPFEGLQKLFPGVKLKPIIPVPAEEFASLCKKDKTLIEKLTPKKEEILKSIFEQASIFKTGDTKPISKEGFTHFIHAMAELSEEELLRSQNFANMTVSAIQKGEIQDAKISIYNLYSIGKLFNSEDEINTIFKLLHSKKCNLDYSSDVITIMDFLKTPAERSVITGFANGSHGDISSPRQIILAARELSNFRAKNKRSMNDSELELFKEFLPAIKHRTEQDGDNYYGKCICDLIPITTERNKKDIMKLLNSNFKLEHYDKEKGWGNGIVRLMQYKEENPDIGTSIISYASRKQKNPFSFDDVRDFFEFYKQNNNPLVKTLAINENLKIHQIKELCGQLHENPELAHIFGRSLTEDSYEYMQFLANGIKKYPQLKEKIAFQTNLPMDFIAKKDETFCEKLNNALFEEVRKAGGDNPKLKALAGLIDNNEGINWASFLPEHFDSKKANLIIDSLYDILSSRQRLDSVKYKNWGEWAIRATTISDIVSRDIKAGVSFSKIVDETAEAYASVFTSSNSERGLKRYGGVLVTPYGPKGAYREYNTRFDVLAQTHRESPYKDLELTQIGPYVRDNRPTMAMIHPEGKDNIRNAISHAAEHYDRIMPIIEKKEFGRKLTFSELHFAADEIARIHYIMTNSTPFFRGSAGIAGILTRSLNKAIGLPNTATRKNVALDLEAFCRSYDDYVENWASFFELSATNY